MVSTRSSSAAMAQRLNSGFDSETPDPLTQTRGNTATASSRRGEDADREIIAQLEREERRIDQDLARARTQQRIQEKQRELEQIQRHKSEGVYLATPYIWPP